jgi:hypothetical protein
MRNTPKRGCSGIGAFRLALIPSASTRRVLALGLSAAMNAPIGDPKFGVFRM